MTIFVIIRISIIFILVFTIITITLMKRPDCMWKCLCRRYSWWLRQSWPLSEFEFWSPLHHCLKLFQIHIISNPHWFNTGLGKLAALWINHWSSSSLVSSALWTFQCHITTITKYHHCLSKSITKSSEPSLIIRRSGSTGRSCLFYHQHLVPLPE